MWWRCSYAQVGVFLKLLQETTPQRAAWFLWLDAASLITTLPFQLPFQSFGNASLVLWSHGGASAEGPLLPDGVTALSPSSRLHILSLADTSDCP